MSLAAEFNNELHSIENRFAGGLSNTSTKKFDDLIKIVSSITGIEEQKIYITAATSRASNLWNRLAQGKPLTQHFSFGLGIIDEGNMQGGISPASKFIGSGVGHYDAIALAVKRNSVWVIGAVLDSDELPIFNRIASEFQGVEIEHEYIEVPNDEDEENSVFSAWYVGTTGYDNDDKWNDYSDEYISKGIWENGWDDRFIDVVNSVNVGDRIAIKSTFTQKYDLPFDNHEKTVGAMRIKAIGVVTENKGDGKHLSVDWKKLDPQKTWFGPGSLRGTIHFVQASDGYVKKQLLDFTFSDSEQDYSICEEYYADVENEEETVITDDGNIENNEAIDENSRLSSGHNILLYGVPGSGKSYTIEHELCRGVKKENRYRVVFHPEYMYSDFVGQILPKVIKSDKEGGKDEVTYKFIPGPFTNILNEAYHHPREKYVLIIEELNRGNAPAIFGEIFQLLDRIGPNSTNREGYHQGTSEYFINNENIAECVYGEKTHEVRIPSNLTILATMNTSDQNVFTLDTAFQRRWQMRQVDNSFEKVSDLLANKQILDTTVRWKVFCQEVNNQILINASEMSSTEDKRLGVYFVTEEDLSFNALDYSEEEYLALSKEDYDSLSESDKTRLDEITEAKNQNRRFPEKVLKYLWDDAFKFNPDRLFKKELRSLEAVISGFLNNRGNARWDILNETIKGNLIEDAKGRS